MNKSYEDLQIWQKAMSLAELIYQITGQFPSEEKYGLVSQLRRCAVSIPSNIAEGCARESQKEFLQFLSVAQGSTTQLKTQILLSQRISYIDDIRTQKLVSATEEIAKMLYGLRRSLSSNQQLTTSN